MNEKLAEVWQKSKLLASRFTEHFREYKVADTEMIVGGSLFVFGMIAGATINEKIMILIYPGLASLFWGAVTYRRQAYGKIDAESERLEAIRHAREQGLDLPADESKIIDVDSADFPDKGTN